MFMILRRRKEIFIKRIRIDNDDRKKRKQCMKQ